MQITNLRPVEGAGSVLARFDIEVTPEIKLLDWSLKKGGRVFPPSPRHGSPAAHLAPTLIAEITRLAMEGVRQHDRTAAA
ncbi:hypothetical protein [Pelagibacterium lacus]|uniref:Uncharacterized protein n=1 Tax=Pelagibacterium lacus TaxID=2282655 RepID=A0A369W7N9_9HYPH|nr:hypothetical protein [Pelagibacterium lacus]RDE10353.1 hypothetical protein DVH29_02910 [Pelagibacterium lacus]